MTSGKHLAVGGGLNKNRTSLATS